MELYSSSNPVFAGFGFYAGLLMFKMILMSLLIGYQRMRKKTFINAEDAAMAQTEVKSVPDEDVERLRRAHLNDIENIPVFLVSGFLFVGTDPNDIFALMMFRIYFVARICHTVVYAVYIVPQPARSICFFVGVMVNIIMIICLFVGYPQM